MSFWFSFLLLFVVPFPARYRLVKPPVTWTVGFHSCRSFFHSPDLSEDLGLCAVSQAKRLLWLEQWSIVCLWMRALCPNLALDCRSAQSLLHATNMLTFHSADEHSCMFTSQTDAPNSAESADSKRENVNWWTDVSFYKWNVGNFLFWIANLITAEI